MNDRITQLESENATLRADLEAAKRQRDELAVVCNAAKSLVDFIEGLGSVRWAYDGWRLKDTKEWCEFYCLVRKLNRDALAEHDAAPSLLNSAAAQS